MWWQRSERLWPEHVERHSGVDQELTGRDAYRNLIEQRNSLEVSVQSATEMKACPVAPNADPQKSFQENQESEDFELEYKYVEIEVNEVWQLNPRDSVTRIIYIDTVWIELVCWHLLRHLSIYVKGCIWWFSCWAFSIVSFMAIVSFEHCLDHQTTAALSGAEFAKEVHQSRRLLWASRFFCWWNWCINTNMSRLLKVF